MVSIVHGHVYPVYQKSTVSRFSRDTSECPEHVPCREHGVDFEFENVSMATAWQFCGENLVAEELAFLWPAKNA